MYLKIKETNQKGITLIALVITIIVLLILAGITIIQITGQDGAPEKAVEAKKANDKGAEYDSIAIEAVSAVAQGDLTLKIDKDALKEGLRDKIKESPDEKIVGDAPWIVTGLTDTKYKIKDDGTVTIVDDDDIVELYLIRNGVDQTSTTRRLADIIHIRVQQLIWQDI